MNVKIYKNHLRNIFTSTKENRRKPFLHKVQCAFIFQILEKKGCQILLLLISKFDFKFSKQTIRYPVKNGLSHVTLTECKAAQDNA